MVAKYPAKMFIYYVPYIHTYIHGHETICNKIEDQRFADLFQIIKCTYIHQIIYQRNLNIESVLTFKTNNKQACCSLYCRQ